MGGFLTTEPPGKPYSLSFTLYLFLFQLVLMSPRLLSTVTVFLIFDDLDNFEEQLSAIL